MIDYKDQFIDVYGKYIKRAGAVELMGVLGESDFFTAPASTIHHEAYEGGLVEHSVKVYQKLCKLVPKDRFTDETLAICGLLHDVCKVGYYTTEYHNKKDENGKWVKAPFYKVADQFPFGHGEKSVYLINDKMKLTDAEAMAIRFHMGAYEGQHIWGTLGEAFKKCPLAFYLHMADMKATYNID